MGVTSNDAHHAASHVGRALGLLLTIRATPYHVHKRQLFLPKDIVDKYPLDPVALAHGESSPSLCDIVYDVACEARAHIIHARQLMKDVPPEARVALMPAVLCDLFLDRLERHNFDLFDPALGLLPTAPASSPQPEKDATIENVSLSGSSIGWTPLKLRWLLIKHKMKGTF